jgi:hypothetical protein
MHHKKGLVAGGVAQGVGLSSNCSTTKNKNKNKQNNNKKCLRIDKDPDWVSLV